MSAAIVPLSMVGLAGFLVALQRPGWTIFVITFFLAINANLVLSLRFGIGSSDQALLLCAVVLMICYRYLYGDELRGTTRMLIAYGLWPSSAAISLIWSTSAGVSFEPLRDFLPNLVLTGALFFLITDRERLLCAFSGLAAGSTLLAVLTVVQYVGGFEQSDFLGLANGSFEHISGDVDAFRPAGPLGDANYYAQMLMPGFGLALGGAVAADRPTLRWIAAFAALFIAGAILLTASRGGLVAMAGVVFITLVWRRRVGLLVLLVPPIIVAMSLMPSYAARVTSFVSAAQAVLTGESVLDTSIAGRLAEMEAARILFMQHPATGVGYGTFENRYQEISANHDLKLRAADRAAHSLYLETAAEQGMVGIAVLLGVIALGFGGLRTCRRIARSSGDGRLEWSATAFGAGSAGLFIASLFLHDSYGQQLWLTLALLLASERAALHATKPKIVESPDHVANTASTS